jgi:phosphoadenosine phosphosulfate reductase
MNHLSTDPDKFEAESAENILSLSLETFAPKIAFASSFGAEDVVVIDLI